MFFFSKSKTPKISASEAVSLCSQGKMTLIDVRERSEVQASGKAVGAVNIPLMRLADMADSRHPDFHSCMKQAEEIAVYCASGARSRMAERTLRNLGYDKVHNIGGLGHWMKAGGGIDPA